MINYKERTLTSFNVSIGTGLMMESLFKPIAPRYDKDRVIPNEVKVDEYDFHIYNMLTLCRNFITSFPETIPHVTILEDKKFMEVFIDEINQIFSLYSGSKCKPVLYLPQFDKMVEHYNKGKVRELTQSVLRSLDMYNKLKNVDYNNYLIDNFIYNKIKLPNIPSEKKVLITTSYPCDYFNNDNLVPILSHTGEIIQRKDFYKFYKKIGNREMDVFPFREILIYLIGDNTTSCIISPRIRAIIHGIALTKKWSIRTTEEGIKDALRKEPEIAPYLKTYKRLYS